MKNLIYFSYSRLEYTKKHNKEKQNKLNKIKSNIH